MSARSRKPTDEGMTKIYDPERPRARMDAPAATGASASSSAPAASSGRRPASSTVPAPAGAPPPASAAAPQARPAPLTPLFQSLEQAPAEQDPTEVTPFPVRPPVEHATPTHIDPVGGAPRPPAEPAAPAERRRGLERSEPIRVISMKDQADAQKPRAEDPRVQLQVQLRSMAEVAGRKDAPVQLGRLAPPRDPRRARARHVRDNVIWAGVAIVLAGAISLAIWLVAGR